MKNSQSASEFLETTVIGDNGQLLLSEPRFALLCNGKGNL